MAEQCRQVIAAQRLEVTVLLWSKFWAIIIWSAIDTMLLPKNSSVEDGAASQSPTTSRELTGLDRKLFSRSERRAVRSPHRSDYRSRDGRFSLKYNGALSPSPGVSHWQHQGAPAQGAGNNSSWVCVVL